MGISPDSTPLISLLTPQELLSARSLHHHNSFAFNVTLTDTTIAKCNQLQHMYNLKASSMYVAALLLCSSYPNHDG